MNQGEEWNRHAKWGEAKKKYFWPFSQHSDSLQFINLIIFPTFPVFWVKFPDFSSLNRILRHFCDWKILSNFSRFSSTGENPDLHLKLGSQRSSSLADMCWIGICPDSTLVTNFTGFINRTKCIWSAFDCISLIHHFNLFTLNMWWKCGCSKKCWIRQMPLRN